jgi:hypothetical protein
MCDLERTIVVIAPAREAFRRLSSVGNLPDCVPQLLHIGVEQDDHVFGMADLGNGAPREVSGFFRADIANLRLDWESDGTPCHRGWLKIIPDGPRLSRITVHLSLPGSPTLVSPIDGRWQADNLEAGFDRALREIQRAIENGMPPLLKAS